jgi:hypothetical protein
MARDWLKNFMRSFAPSIRNERETSRQASAAMIDGLAAVTALAIMGRQGDKNEIIEATVILLRQNIERDLMHMTTNVRPSQTSN